MIRFFTFDICTLIKNTGNDKQFTMCGRFALYSAPFSLAKRFGAETPPELHPRYNVAPTQSIPIVREESGARRFALARRGLIPHWANDMNIYGHFYPEFPLL